MYTFYVRRYYISDVQSHPQATRFLWNPLQCALLSVVFSNMRRYYFYALGCL
jgi:hypothetical protein